MLCNVFTMFKFFLILFIIYCLPSISVVCEKIRKEINAVALVTLQ